MKKFRKILFFSIFLLAVLFTFQFIISSKVDHKAYAAAVCANPGSPWVKVNIYVKIIDSSGNFVGWSNNFQFFVTALIPTGSHDVQYIDGAFNYLPGGNGVPQGYPGTDGTQGAYQSRTSIPINSNSTYGGEHVCPLSPSQGAGSAPAYDFTDGTNGNLYLNCANSHWSGYTAYQNIIESAAFAFTPLSVSDFPAGSFVGDDIYAPGATAIGSGGNVAYLFPNGVTDLNYSGQNYITWTYQLRAAPVGHLDVASCSLIAGWAFDPGDSSDSIAVDIYVNGPAGSGAPGERIIANAYRGDVDAAFGISGNHGFNIVPQTDGLLSSYWANTGSSFSVYLYAIGQSAPNQLTGNNPLIGYAGNIGPCNHPVLGCNGISTTPSVAVADEQFGLTAAYKQTSNGAVYNGSVTLNSISGPGSVSGISLPNTQSTSASYPGGSVTFTPIIISAPGNYLVSYTVSQGNSPNPVTCTYPLTVVTKPFITVCGGDVMAGSGIGQNAQADIGAGILSLNNSTSPYVAGSNLAAFAADLINQYATSVSSSNCPTPTNSGGSPEALSFGNTNQATVNPACLPSSPWGGCFTTAYNASDYYAWGQQNYPNQIAVPAPYLVDPSDTSFLANTLNCPSLTNSTGTTTYYCNLTSAGNQTTIASLGSGTIDIPVGVRIVLFIKGDVLIDSNICLTGNNSPICAGGSYNISNMPSLYVVASGNIWMDSTRAKYVSGVYVAQKDSSAAYGGGNVYTCTNGFGFYPASSLFATCNSKLTIDGAIIAGTSIRFERAFGSVPDNTPSEVFTYNPSVWLVNPFNNLTTLPSVPVYNSITDLPPVL